MIPFCKPKLTNFYKGAVGSQIESGWIGPGLKTEEFADKLAAYTKASYCLLTTSGTVALQIAAYVLMKHRQRGASLKIGVPGYCVNAVPNAFASLGHRLYAIDIDMTGCMCPSALAAAIRDHALDVICFVDFSGNCENAELVMELATSKGVGVIEDAACGLGHWHHGVHAGTFDRIGILSFSVPKILTTGQGGAILFLNEDDYEYAKDYINQGGPDDHGLSKSIGCNLRFNDILASLGFAQMIELENILEHKKKVFDIINSSIQLYKPNTGIPLHHIVFCKRSIGLVENLQSRGIDARRQYGVLYDHPAGYLSDYVFLPISKVWNERSVYLPFGMGLTFDDAATIGKEVKEALVELGEA